MTDEEDIQFANWSHVKTFQEALKENRDFVAGKTNSTPYHAGPLHEDSQLLMNYLLQLNDYGLLTTDGQGRVNEYQNHNGTEFYDIEQRCYLEFFVLKTANSTRFIKDIQDHPSLTSFVSDSDENETVPSVPGCLIVNVTRQRGYDNLEDQEATEWDECTNLHCNGFDSLDDVVGHNNLGQLSHYNVRVAFKEQEMEGLEELLIKLWEKNL